MRKYMIIYLFFVLFSFTLFAEDNAEVSIKALIERIKEAGVEDKRVLINQLKLELRKMNKESRKKTVMELKNSLNQKKVNIGHQNRTNRVHRLMRHRHFGGGHR
ncbi:MAG: hypothetical protein GXO60_05615 [Epsilonproteobacteria bacterium]|nr:hypothetical protein [Campylobacterota bacterium]